MADVFDQIHAQNQGAAPAAGGGDVFDQIHAGQGAPAYQQPEGSAASRFGSGFWDYSLGGLLNLVKGAGSLAAQVGGAASGAPPMLDPNSAGGKLIQGIVMGHVDQAQKAKDAWERGQYTEALGHTLATFLPLLGPAAAHIGETAGGSQPKFDAKGNVVESGQAPDIPQALGQAAGLGASYALPAAAEKIPRPNLTPAGPLTAAPRIQAAQDLMAEGEARHVRLSAGDISQNPAIQNMEVAAEKIPGVGMGKFRIGQQADVKLAAQKLQSNAFEKFLDTEPSDIGDLQKAAQDGDARATQVLDKFKVAGSDPALNQQASIGLADWSTRDTATKLYDKVQDLAEQHHLGDVPMTNTQAALKSSLAELGPAILQDKPTIALLNEIRNGISPKPAPLVKPSGLLGPNGQPIPAPEAQPVAPTNTYQLIRQLHSDLGARIRDYYSPDSNSLIGEKGVGYLERVQHAMEGDMSAYASQSGVPEIVKAGQLADEYYKTARVPFKNGQLAAAAQSTEPDQIFQQFIKAGKGDRAQNFYNALDDRGQAAIRYNMISKAVEDATDERTGIFSPQKYFTSANKLKDAYGVFFKGGDKFEIDGFNNLMAHTTRAGQFAENPPTGQRVIPFLEGGAALAAIQHPLMVGAPALALIGGARALFNTAAGRGLLLKAAGLKPGTPVMNSFWQTKIAPVLGKGSAAAPIAAGAQQQQ